MQAIPEFSSMSNRLRATLDDLILGTRFLKDRWLDVGFEVPEYENLTIYCRWLSIVQNRSCCDVFNNVCPSPSAGVLTIGSDQFKLNFMDKFG